MNIRCVLCVGDGLQSEFGNYFQTHACVLVRDKNGFKDELFSPFYSKF